MVDSAIGWRARAGKIVVAVLLVVVSVVPGARPVQACTCDASAVSFAETLADPHTVAFVGQAPSELNPIDGFAYNRPDYTFNVEQPVRGNPGPTVVVDSGFGSCGVRFPLDVPIGVVVYRTDDGRLTANICSRNVISISVLNTWASGTLPQPTGSGRIAGVGSLGPETYGVVDEQMRVLGYIPVPAESYLDSCPGGRYLAGFGTIEVDDSSGYPLNIVFSVNLTNLSVTRLALSGVKQVERVDCLDPDGAMLVSHYDAISEGDGNRSVEIVSRSGNRQAVPRPAGATSFEGPTWNRNAVVWFTENEVIATDLDGNEIRRVADQNGSRFMSSGQLVLIPANTPDEMTVVDLTTGATSTVSDRSDWRLVERRLSRLVNATTLDVIDTTNGQRAQVPISNGPPDDGWKLAQSYLNLQLVKEGADTFYVIDASGAATSYPEVGQERSSFPWLNNTVFSVDFGGGQAWLESSSDARRVLEPYGPGLIERIDGPVLVAGACGTTAIPTVGYKCDPPRLPELL